ncbi:MAG: sensor histidine kinase, partial [Actinobacteria bacterium]
SVEAAGIAVTLDTGTDLGDVPAFADVSAYRIAQEALTNVMRHAKAHAATVSVSREGDDLVIEVTDDGRGASVSQLGTGHGIAGMRERAAALGGTFEAGPLPAGGFRVAAHLPLTRGA